MKRVKLVLAFALIALSGCSYPSAVMSNLIVGASQGGWANPVGLLSGALTNGLFNSMGWLPSP